jgi:cytidylate kinase
MRTIESIVAEQVRRWEIQRAKAGRAAPRPEPVIAISREYGAGGAAVGQAVAAQLGFSYWNREIVQEIARSTNLSTTLVASRDERHDPALLATYRELLDRKLATSRYFTELVKVVHTIAAHGSAVMVGRGVVFMLPPERVLRVRVVCPLAQRIKNLVERGEAAARTEIAAVDAERRAFVKDHLDGNIELPSAYDLHVNSGSYGVERAAQVVVAAYRLRFGVTTAITAGPT